MTDDRMALIELIEKGADSDLVRELLAFAADRMMELEVEGLGRQRQRDAQRRRDAIGAVHRLIPPMQWQGHDK